MTQEEFNKLSVFQQEEFINAGGVVSLSERTECKSQESSGLSSVTVASVKRSRESEENHNPLSAPQVIQKESSIPPSEIADEKPVGRVEDVSIPSSSQPAELYTEGFDIQDPLELLLMVDEYVQSGRVKLHKWQTEFMLDFAVGGQSDETPFQAAVRACNGSGKDKYIIATCVVWLCMRYKETLGVVTSASGSQLDSQTCFHIKRLCEKINAQFGTEKNPIWKCNYRYYECVPTKSYIKCFATDEPGKAEGFHPIDSGHRMALFASEDKTIPDDINTAMNKCTGYTHRVHASTPGAPLGHFYDICSTAVDRKSIKSVTEVKPTDYVQYHIKASDCSHLRENYINQMKRDLPGGEFGPAYNSQVNAEFGTTDEMVVIPYTYIWRAKNKDIKDWIQEPHNTGGLDLSDGGDETVLIIRNGNRVLKVIPFRFDNAEDTYLFLDEQFKENGLAHPDALIFADAGGMGGPMLNTLIKRYKYTNIRLRDNRHKSSYPLTYKNWGSQSWFNAAKLFTQNEIILCDDDKLVKQLSSRRYKIIGNIHQLLSKVEQKSKEIPSPDRADALILAFSNYKSTFVSKMEEATKPFEQPEEEKPVSEFTQRSKMSKYGPRNIEDLYKVNNGQKDFSSLQEEIAEHNQRVRLANN